MQLIKELLEMHTKRSSFAKFSHLNSPFSLSLLECLEFEIVIVTFRTSKRQKAQLPTQWVFDSININKIINIYISISNSISISINIDINTNINININIASLL